METKEIKWSEIPQEFLEVVIGKEVIKRLGGNFYGDVDEFVLLILNGFRKKESEITIERCKKPNG